MPLNDAGTDMWSDELCFSVNGKRHRLVDPDPTILLIDYLRSPVVGLTGPKIGCGEGGCGACTVLLTSRDPRSGALFERTVNACLRPICSLDGAHVTTIEDVGSTRFGLNPIQQSMVDHNASQCGFCSPGFVMAMYGLMRENHAPTAEQIEDRFDGNLCRCTGYRGILDAMQSFAPNAGGANERAAGPPVAEQLVNRARPLHFASERVEWFRPLALDDVFALLKRYERAATVQILNGNTSTGIYKKNVYDPSVCIDVSQIAELSGYQLTADGLQLGAGMSLSDVARALDEAVAVAAAEETAGFAAFRKHLRRVANVHVRNVGTIAGNLMLVIRPRDPGSPFISDVALVLMTLGATLTVRFADEPGLEHRYDVADAIERLSASSATFLITGFQLPFTRARERVVTEKVARREQNAHAIVNAGFRVMTGEDDRVTEFSGVFGGIASRPYRSPALERALVGASLNDETIASALEALRNEVDAKIVPMPDAGVSSTYRAELASGLFFRFAAASRAHTPTNGTRPSRALSLGRQVIVASGEQDRPVEKRVPKVEAAIQVTGEARYTHDVIAPPNTLHAAYVVSQHANATFTYDAAGGLAGLIATLHARFPGFVDFVTVADVPPGGKNMQGSAGDDPVFAPGTVTAFGQPIGIAVAETHDVAVRAARFVNRFGVSYAPAGTVALTIADARALPGGSGLFAELSKTRTDRITRPGSDQAWLANPAPEDGRAFFTGSQSTGAQAHFYLETQAAVVVPDEMSCVKVYSSTQSLKSVQSAVARVLKIPANRVEVQVTRLGGGYGGKETRPPFIACAAAVAAWKLDRPVRLVLDRNTDMTIIGKRHEFEGTYYASVEADGTIRKLKLDYASNGGCTYDVTFPVMDLVLLSADGAYMNETFQTTGACYRTNLETRTAMRSFGFIQCSLIAEEAVERIAYELEMLPEDLRKKNFYRDGTPAAWDATPYGQQLKTCIMNAVWDQLMATAEFREREAAVREFNARNRWKKRGISMIPIKYGVSYTFKSGNQGSAYVNVYAADGTVILQHGGVEMGQGIDTKMMQIAAETLGIPFEIIRTMATDTANVANTSSTGASTGADLNGGAVKGACQELRARLEEFCANQPAGSPLAKWKTDWTALWPTIVSAAYGERIDLSAQYLYRSPDISEIDKNNPTGDPWYYFTYSAAVSEVEIDVLTGESVILRSDLLYDAGQSLNPIIDVGQVQGGFVQGIGNVMTEQLYYSPEGRLIPNGTWNYKPPCSKTIPVDFRVSLYTYPQRLAADGTPIDHHGIQSSKSTGEPPLVLANTVFFAIKHAILAARKDAGVDGWFSLDAPATIERIQQACASGANLAG